MFFNSPGDESEESYQKHIEKVLKGMKMAEIMHQLFEI